MFNHCSKTAPISAWASMNITIRARSFSTMNHTADLLSACAGSACDSRQNQWGAVDISMSTLLWGMLWEALTVNIGVNGISLPPDVGLNGDGTLFTVDLNLMVALMVTSVGSA